MAVILKSNELEYNQARLCRLNLVDVGVQAEAIIAEARARGQVIENQAQLELEKVKEQASQAGQQAGYQAGLEQGRQQGYGEALQDAQKQFADQFSDLTGALEQLLGDFDAHKHRMNGQAQQELVALAVAIAAKVIKSVAGEVPQVAVDNVRGAVALVCDNSDLQVHMNPADLAMLEKFDPKVRQRWFGRKHVKFVSDETVQRGGCLINTPAGQIDAQLAAQVENISQQLTPLLTGRVKNWVEQINCSSEDSRADRNPSKTSRTGRIWNRPVLSKSKVKCWEKVKE